MVCGSKFEIVDGTRNFAEECIYDKTYAHLHRQTWLTPSTSIYVGVARPIIFYWLVC